MLRNRSASVFFHTQVMYGAMELLYGRHIHSASNLTAICLVQKYVATQQHSSFDINCQILNDHLILITIDISV